MKNRILLFIMVILFSIISITLINTQSTQQFNKIYLNPFYRSTMNSNTNYSYSVTINPPDAISLVVNAMVEFNIQINGQTQLYTLWVNNQSCNNPTYGISTAFSTTGEIQIYFDCSNVITHSGTYTLTLKSSVNTGAITGWLDLTYMNKPKGELALQGTDYFVGDNGTIFLQLLDSNKQIISDATCYLNTYYPNKSLFLNNVMTDYLADGLYYYDVVIPNTLGVYMMSAKCILPADAWRDTFADATKIEYQKDVTISGGKVYPTTYNVSYQTDAKSPFNYSDDYAQWTNPSYAIGSDDLRATTSVNNEKEDWYNFSFNLSSNATITGIEVLLEGSTSTGSTGVDVELSWNGGSSYTSTSHTYTTTSSTDAIRVLGNKTDLWGRTWNYSELSNSNFRVRLNKKGDAGTNHRIDDLRVNVSYNVSSNPNGIIQSIPLNLSGTYWNNFSSDYYGNISWEIRNNSNYTLCSSLGNILSCANTTTPIKLFANLSAGSWIDSWLVDWNLLIPKEEIRGGGELNVNAWAGNGSLTIVNSTEISNSVWSYVNRTLTYYPLEITANEIWNFVNRNLTYYPDVTNYTKIASDIWNYVNKTLTYYPTPNSLTAQEIWEYVNRNLTYYEVNNISTSDIWNYMNRNLTYYDLNNITPQDIWNYVNRTLTYYELNTMTVSDIWNYADRNLTYYEVTNVNETAISLKVWENENRTLTYYELNNISPQDIWNYSGNRTLTYYQITEINETSMAISVWNYTSRNLTYYLISDVTASELWNYANRSLTNERPASTIVLYSTTYPISELNLSSLPSQTTNGTTLLTLTTSPAGFFDELNRKYGNWFSYSIIIMVILLLLLITIVAIKKSRRKK